MSLPRTWWPHKEVGENQDAKREILTLFGDSGFIRRSLKALLKQIITIATNPGDLVLDSFAGSGTTGAVAHKMGRRWIMVELGEHCHTHIIPRLKKVIDGEDQGGDHRGVGLERRRRVPLLPPRAVAARKGQVGQLGHQQGVQRRHAGRGDVQAGGLHLRAQRRGLLAARPFHRARLHLRHHADLDARAAAAA